MQTITNNELGLALHIVATYLNTPKQDRKKTTRDIASEWACEASHLQEEQRECLDKKTTKLYDWLMQDEEELQQQSLFEPTEWLNKLDALISLAKSGKLKVVAVETESFYRYYEDDDAEAGILIDPSFLLTFAERIAKAKHLVGWRHGPFFVVVDGKLPESLIG